MRTAEEWDVVIRRAAAAVGLPMREAYEALYLIFLGRRNGPRIAHILAALDPAFVMQRLQEASRG